jgi:hypothetical protein
VRRMRRRERQRLHGRGAERKGRGVGFRSGGAAAVAASGGGGHESSTGPWA